MKYTIEQIRALCDAATPGPWYAHATDDEYCMNARYIGLRPCEFKHDNECGLSAYHDAQEPSDHVVAITLLQKPRLADMDNHDANTAFIAATDPDTVRALLDEIARLRGALEEIAECGDTGRGDGNPEECPAHSDVYAWSVARAALGATQ